MIINTLTILSQATKGLKPKTSQQKYFLFNSCFTYRYQTNEQKNYWSAIYVDS